MALPVLDGNQSATTLSSVVTGGEHIVAHSVVSLGTTAIANITSAVSGVNIGGTVTANINGTPSVTFGAITGSASIIGTPTVTIPQLNRIIQSVATDGVADATLNFVKIGGHQDGSNQTAHVVHVSAGGAMKVDATDSSVTFGAVRGTVTISNFPSTQTIAGTVTANVGSVLGFNEIYLADADNDTRFSSSYPFPIAGTVTISNSVTIGSLPAISGAVTVSNATAASAVFVKICGEREGAGLNEPREILTDDAGMLYVRLAPNNARTADPVIYDPVGGTAYINVRQQSGTSITVGNSVTIGSLPAISGTVTANLSESIIEPVDSTNATQVIAVHIKDADGNTWGAENIFPVVASGTVTVGNSVTIGSLPSISGTVTAAQTTAANLNATVVGSGSFTAAQATAANLNATVVQGTATNLKTQAENYQGGSAVGSGNPLQVTLANTGANSTAILTTNRGATGEATVSNFTSTTSATLKSSNSNRKVLTIYNEGAGNLHVLYGSGTASTTNYSVKLFTGDYLEIDKYTGQVNAIFATAGTARVTEIT